MNRKEFIKSLVGAGALVAATPAILEAAERSSMMVSSAGCSVPTGPSTPYVPPTDEELWEQHLNEGIRSVESYNGSNAVSGPYRYIGGMGRAQYERVKSVAPANGWEIVETIRDGQTTFKIGNQMWVVYS